MKAYIRNYYNVLRSGKIERIIETANKPTYFVLDAQVNRDCAINNK
jgi:hypothetical protein